MRVALLTVLIVTILPPPAALGQADVPLPRPRPVVESPDTSPPLPRLHPAQPVTSAETVIAPPRPHRTTCPVILSGAVAGQPAPPIGEGQCVVAEPWTVSAVRLPGGAVEITGGAVLTCEMAQALSAWTQALDDYFRASYRAGLARILTGTSYMCRPRNNQPGAQLSEHGHANGLDVTGFELTDGTLVGPLADWADPGPAGRAVRFSHQAACAQFTTVLGPDANAQHRDHLHVDLGCHGRDCVARVCE